MSQVYTLKNEISEDDFLRFIEQDDDISIAGSVDTHINLIFEPSPSDHLIFENGILLATSPSDQLYEKLGVIAKYFNTQVYSEDEAVVDIPAEISSVNARSFWLGWPIIGVIIVIYAVVKWLT